MSNAHETLIRLILPEGILEYFELTNVSQSQSGFNIYLEEKNLPPVGYEKSQLESKGFLPETAIQDFPIRGHKVALCIKGCGCTSVDWTKDPILPGEKGMIRVVYNTKHVGFFSRGVDIYSNDPANPKINIRLKGTVAEMPTDQANVVNTPQKPPAEKW